VYVSAPVNEASATIAVHHALLMSQAGWAPASYVWTWQSYSPYLAGFMSASREGRRTWSSYSVIVRYNRGHSAGPWRRYDVSSMCQSAHCFLLQLRQVVQSV